ncbi:MAG: CpsD/CapB family tyrosine-protein kinase [Streptococcaceae bacterium]|jgi:capsular exopolysaccharide synthesis family protein|nr:CpsD/CapB family tyrosine-protein kinase [Streptococcaceae bacterium]
MFGLNTKKKGIASIPLVTLLDSKSVVAEQFRMIRSSIRFAEVDQKIKTLIITSSGMSEGKSMCASNLAVVFAQAGSKVLLVDADFRRPTIHLTWSISNTKGLSDSLLHPENSLSDYVKQSNVTDLDLLASGSQPPNPSELLETQRMKEVLDETASKYDLVIFDSPPLAMPTDSQILANRVDGTILVTRERKTKNQELKQAIDLLKKANAKVLGAIYNGKKALRNYDYGYIS